MKINSTISKMSLLGTKKPLKDPNESRTKSMVFDVDAIDNSQAILSEYSKLQDVRGFVEYPGTVNGELNKDMVIKYVVLLYSTDSILNQRPPLELRQRKLKAADIVGFDRDKKGNFKEEVVEKLFNLKSSYIIEAVFDYLMFQNTHLWTSICSTEQALMESNKIIMTPVSDEKDKDNVSSMKSKLQLIPINTDTKKLLDNLYKDFFMDNEDVKQKVKTEQKYFRIEDLAKEA